MPQPGVFICPTSDILPAVASLEYELLSLSLPLPLQYAAKHATPQPQPPHTPPQATHLRGMV
jgi:hypothetical protein